MDKVPIGLRRASPGGGLSSNGCGRREEVVTAL